MGGAGGSGQVGTGSGRRAAAGGRCTRRGGSGLAGGKEGKEGNVRSGSRSPAMDPCSLCPHARTAHTAPLRLSYSPAYRPACRPQRPASHTPPQLPIPFSGICQVCPFFP